MASVSQTFTPWWRRQGTSIDGASSSISARTPGSSGPSTTSSNSSPAKRASNHPRKDQDE